MDMKEKNLTVTKDVDPVDIVQKLRKGWFTEILSVGPAKESEKKKEEPKKDEGKKEDVKKKDSNDQITELVKAYQAYNSHLTTHYYVPSVEENLNSCVIC